ncbi:hypothetical protein Pelo_18538 [Pelomyxa schiedti]|nr:hypothetical protein Pelo_18538 [Pelomyxa schiedti]
MGAVWSRSWPRTSSSSGEESEWRWLHWTVEGAVGDDRFVATDDSRDAWVIDSGGGAVARLETRRGVPAPRMSFWARNAKWLVRVDFDSEPKKLIVWRMSGAAPVGPGVGVECTEDISWKCARFSPFSPCGDELVIGSYENTTASLSGRRERLSFVDIDKSIASGVTVVTKEYPLPLIHLVDFLWAEPDTILTMHSDTESIVYNTKTGESKVFPVSQYGCMKAIPPEHIAFSLGSTGTTNERKTTVRVTHSTDEGIYAVEMEPSRTVALHDSITGKPLFFLTITTDLKFLY